MISERAANRPPQKAASKSIVNQTPFPRKSARSQREHRRPPLRLGTLFFLCIVYYIVPMFHP